MEHSLEIQVDTKPEKLTEHSLHVFSELKTYDWILFTSKHAVTFFDTVLKNLNIPFPQNVHVGAVGSITASVLVTLGYPVHIIPSTPNSASLAEALGVVSGMRILLPRSAIAPSDIIETLQKKGAYVETIALYTTVPHLLSVETKQLLIAGAYTSLIFKSPSGIAGLRSQFSVQEWHTIQKIHCVCIGKTTAKAASEHGFTHVAIKTS